MTFHINTQLFAGQKILKVKRDYYDPYVWVLGQNNTVYRVNSLTMAVDNYTSKFAAYSNLQFIDIAGPGQDTVFVAASSPDVIEYYNGSLRDIGKARGLKDTVNSIGLASQYQYLPTGTLQIGTNHGLGTYFYVGDSLRYDLYQTYTTGPVKILSETYRTEMITDDHNDAFPPEVFYPVIFATDGITAWAYDIRHIAQSGSQLNTAYYVPVGIVMPNLYGGSFFWGNASGLYQENININNLDPSDFNHFLSNVNVNKITDIFGLASFYYASPPIAKDNLLLGTDSGFYFSSSLLAKFVPVDVAAVNLFHYAPLGNLRINDLCVNTTGTNFYSVPTSCENGVWLATDNGLYLLNPDYGAYLSSTTMANALYIDQPLADTVTNINVCQGATVTARLNTNFINSNLIQWEKNGKDIIGATRDSLQIDSAGEYYAILYDPCGNLHIQTNRIKVNIITRPVFTFNYPAKIQQCNNNPDTLQTTYNPGYHYQWYTNGALNGDTTNACIVTQSGKYKVEVSACNNSWVPSREVEVDLINLPVPQVTADKAVYCAEDTAKLSVNAPVDPSYHINWYQDGNLLAAKTDSASIKVTSGGNYTATLTSTVGPCTQTSTPIAVAFTPAPVFTFNYPDQLQYCTGTPLTLTATGSSGYQYRWYKNDTLNNVTNESLAITQNGKYKVEVSSCAGSWVASKEVQVTFITVAVPVIATDKKNYCIGDNAVLSLAATYDPDFNIQWYNNNVMVPNSTGQPSITINQPGNYTVSLVNGSVNTDGSTCIQTSAVQPITFDPPPAVSIQQTVNTTLCAGQTVTLNAKYSSGTVQWSTGETADQITVTQAGKYKVTVTSPAGCQADTSINVTFLPDPVFSLRDTSICTYKKQVVTLTAPPGFAAYSWNNGASTAETYAVTQPQTVSLTVTDANGCQATQQIKVADQCPMVVIPNAFTPNGDGINDTWVIEGLDETGTVKVFTRWGAEVYQSVGYSTPWNGEYAGKKLSPGVYYYIVTAKSGTQKFSGSLTIIY